MCAEEIEVCCIGMSLWSFTGSWWNGSPIEGDARKMRQLDLFPFPEPVNPCFHPVMIGSDGDEEREECAESQVAAVIPIEFVQRHGADEADEENGQSPSRKCAAGPRSLRDETVSASDCLLDLGDARECHNQATLLGTDGKVNQDRGMRRSDKMMWR